MKLGTLIKTVESNQNVFILEKGSRIIIHVGAASELPEQYHGAKVEKIYTYDKYLVVETCECRRL